MVRKRAEVSDREVVEAVRDQDVLIGNLESEKIGVDVVPTARRGTVVSCAVKNLRSHRKSRVVAGLVESMAVLGVSTERVLHRGTVGVWVRCPACIVASGVIRGSRTLRKQQTRPFAMAPTFCGNCACKFCADGLSWSGIGCVNRVRG